jgi:formylglycine-generating enzyme required for sulfatase activity
MARGNSSTSGYPWGQDWGVQKCNTTESGNGKPVKIGNYQMDKSLSGCFDIIGNISEWCYDYYDETYYQRSPSKEPKGPEMGTVKAIRGGSWISKGVDIKTTYRKPGGISLRNKTATSQVGFWSNYIGFRCAKDVK